MRIALCITDLDLGGAERCLVELARGLDRRRFVPTVYCLAPPPAPREGSLLPALEAAGIETHCLGARRSREFLSIAWQLRRLLVERKPDLLQTMLFHANVVGRIAARWAGVPRVVSGIRVAEPHRRWRRGVERLTDRLVDRHVCVSRSVARFAARSGGLPAEKLVVIPNGIDVARFEAVVPATPGSLGIGPGRRLVTFVGRLDRQKRVAWLLATCRDWMTRLSDCDLLLVGKGPLEPALRAECGRLGLAGRVHFAGWRPDVPAILAASRLLVLTSAWEGMPNVVLEAMASRLPVVATRAEGVEELLGAAAGEQTVAGDDSAAFSATIVKLLTDLRLAEEIGQKNRLRAEREFSLGGMVRAYENLWASLVAGGRARGENIS
jgi:glycosyltransferase involved in cell wall biosynthesis